MNVRWLLLVGFAALYCQTANSASAAAPQKCMYADLVTLWSDYVAAHSENTNKEPLPWSSTFPTPAEIAKAPREDPKYLRLDHPAVRFVTILDNVVLVSDCAGHLVGSIFLSSNETLTALRRGPILPGMGETVELDTVIRNENENELHTVSILGMVDSALKPLWNHYSYVHGPKLEKEYQVDWHTDDHDIEVTGEIRAYPDTRGLIPRKVTPVHETYCWSRKASSYVACAGKSTPAHVATSH
jgi:hypothetical protein